MIGGGGSCRGVTPELGQGSFTERPTSVGLLLLLLLLLLIIIIIIIIIIILTTTTIIIIIIVVIILLIVVVMVIMGRAGLWRGPPRGTRRAVYSGVNRSAFKEGSLRGGDHAKNGDSKRQQQETRVKRTPHHPFVWISSKTTLVLSLSLSLTSIDSRSTQMRVHVYMKYL